MTEAQTALAYLAGAGEHIQAAIITLNTLIEIKSNKYVPGQEYFTAMWRIIPMPASIPLGIQLAIKGLQIAILERGGRDYNDLMADIETAYDRVTVIDGLSLMIVAVYAGKPIAMKNYKLAIRMVAKVLSILPQAEQQYGAHLQLPPHLHFENFLWMDASSAGTPGDLIEWITAVEGLNADQLQGLIAESATATRHSRCGTQQTP